MFNQQGWGFFWFGFFLKPVTEHIQISLCIVDLYLVSNHQTKITTLQQLQRVKPPALHNLLLLHTGSCLLTPLPATGENLPQYYKTTYGTMGRLSW
uniref:Secreted protein n=1 Tax=Buteo japonicus TaxID=224669 RepID=A0A8C0BXP2_9AVES